jgi:hypothetical protein
MPQQRNTQLGIVKINTKLHSTSSESQCLRVASYSHICSNERYV